MAESMVTAIQRRLKPEFRVVAYESNHYAVIDETTRILLHDETNNVIRFRDTPVPTGRMYNNLVASLRRLEAITEHPKRVSELRPKHVVSYSDPKDAIIIAKETLADRNATARERGLARNYLNLLRSHSQVRSLAQRLGQRLTEIETYLEDEVDDEQTED